MKQHKWIYVSLGTLSTVAVLVSFFVVQSSLHNAETAREKQFVLNKFDDALADSDFEGCQKYAQKIYQIGKERGDKMLQSRALSRLAFIELIFSRWGNHWRKKLVEAEELCGVDPSLAKAELLVYRGFLKGQYQHKFEEASRELNEAIQIASELGEPLLLAKGHLHLSQILVYLQLHEQALEMAARAYEIAKTTDDDTLLLMSLRRLLSTHALIGTEDKKYACARELLALKPGDLSAQFELFFSEESSDFVANCCKRIAILEEKSDKAPIDYRRLLVLRIRLATIYTGQKKFEQALRILEQANEISSLANSGQDLDLIHAERIKVLIAKGNIELARSEFEELTDNKFSESSISKSDIVFILEQLGDYQRAFEQLQKFKNLSQKGRLKVANRAIENSKRFWEVELKNYEYIKTKSYEARRAIVQYAILISLLGFGGVAAVVLFTRIHSLRTSQRELEGLVSKRTTSLRKARMAAEMAAASKGEFLARMNHEIRNPLQAIIGYTDMLQSDMVDERFGGVIKGLQSSSEHLMGLANDVLDISKIEEGALLTKQLPFSVRNVCDNVVQILQEAADSKGLGLTVHVNQNVPNTLVGDETNLRQIMINLVENGIKYTDFGGVELRANWLADVENGSLEVIVSDSGAGIPREYQSRIFEPFANLPNSHRGKGIGLYISKTIVDLLNGNIEYFDGESSGATFRLQIPYSTRCELNTESETTNCFRKALKVLVVDDKDVIREIVESQLRRIGHHPRSCETMDETLDIMENWNPEVVFMDLRMPNHSGFEILDQIRQLQIRQPYLVAMTGDATHEVRMQAVQAGFNAFLAKPFKKSQLRTILNSDEVLNPAVQNSMTKK